MAKKNFTAAETSRSSCHGKDSAAWESCSRLSRGSIEPWTIRFSGIWNDVTFGSSWTRRTRPPWESYRAAVTNFPMNLSRNVVTRRRDDKTYGHWNDMTAALSRGSLFSWWEKKLLAFATKHQRWVRKKSYYHYWHRRRRELMHTYFVLGWGRSSEGRSQYIHTLTYKGTAVTRAHITLYTNTYTCVLHLYNTHVLIGAASSMGNLAEPICQYVVDLFIGAKRPVVYLNARQWSLLPDVRPTV